MVRIASPTFIGRAAELAALDEGLEAAAQGRTSTVLIGGDAGVGKTRLLETWNARARDRGATIAAGSCLDLGESGPAYVAVVQAFRDLLGPLTPAAVDALVGSDRSALALIISELSVATGPASNGQPSTPIAQTRLLDRLVRVLERASSDGPLLLELEDIHWADPSTRAFLQYLVANSRTAKLLILATFRAEEAGREHPLRSLIRQVVRHPGVRKIDLLPLDVDELRQQLHGILGEPPTTRLLAAVHARSEGNALFVEELVASGDPAVELPASIGAALLARTSGLSSYALAALRVAAVTGRTTPYDVLRSATGLADDQLVAALREVVEANILEPEHAGELYRFRHALLEEAIYKDTLPGERRRLHGSVAEALSAQTEGWLDDPELVSQLAHHWFEAKDHERALETSLAAADTAVRQAAHVEALYHYERVLELWDRAAVAHADIRLADILERTSRSASLAGEPHKAAMYGRRALDELDLRDDAVVRVRVLDEIARALHSVTDDAVEYEQRLGEMKLDGLPVREQMIVLDARVRALRRKGDPAASIAAQEALRLADGSHQPKVKGDAHLIMARHRFDLRDMDGAILQAQLARGFASAAGDAETELEARKTVYMAYTETGQHEMAIDAARAARDMADHVGLSRWGDGWASFVEAKALFELGQISESSQVIDEALLDAPAGWAFRRMQMLAAQVSTVSGSFEDAAAHLEAARIPNATTEEENRRPYLALVRAELARSGRRFQDVGIVVEAAAAQVVGLSAFSDMSEMIWALAEIGLDAEAERAEVGRAAGDALRIAAAGTAATRLLSYVDRVRRQRDDAGILDTGMHRGDEALIEGHLARIEGRDDPALWVAAAAEFPPSSVEALTARYRQAEAMLAAKASKAEIGAVMALAHSKALEAGARPLASRFEKLAQRARIDLRPAPSAVSSDEQALELADAPEPGTVALRGRGLSDREIEVLTLVSAGFSNQDIGARLFISDKTASVHVSHILRKLDAATRTEAATIGVRLGLPDVERENERG